jgi:hypothetical protein
VTASVVDVNVPIVANGQSPQADLPCVSACVDALAEIVGHGMIVLDDGRQILSEYQHYLSPAGQPGLGDAFMQWVWEHQAVENRCEQVSSAEFPQDPELRTFDPSDRKYVAAALASHNQPEILNAVDPDWWQHRAALARNGVRVRFLCPQHMA